MGQERKISSTWRSVQNFVHVAIAEVDLLLLHLTPDSWNVQNENKVVTSETQVCCQIQKASMDRFQNYLLSFENSCTSSQCMSEMKEYLKSLLSCDTCDSCRCCPGFTSLHRFIQATQVQLCRRPVATLADGHISRPTALQRLHQGSRPAMEQIHQ